MTKKHFVALANSLRAARPVAVSDPVAEQARLNQWRLDVAHVAGACASFNPGFDRARFLAACGVQS